jgi:hypothetical protein
MAEDTDTAAKYPRTPHLPFSPGVADDDEQLASIESLLSTSGQAVDVVITEKLDGGNCCMKDGAVFARTHKQPATHDSFAPLKQLYKTQIQPLLGDAGARRFELFGENMVAVHSIDYTSAASQHVLPSPFFLFAVYDRAKHEWMSWDNVEKMSALLSGCAPTPPVLFRGTIGSEDELRRIIADGMASGSLQAPGAPAEGFVVRRAGAFPASHFDTSIAKYVRKGHVQTDDTFKWGWKKANFTM